MSVTPGTMQTLKDMRWNADENRWESAKAIIGDRRVTLGPQASQQWLDAPDHLAMVLARYRAAAALIGGATDIVELGCGEGIGARILIQGRGIYYGIDNDDEALAVAAELYGDDDVQFRYSDILGYLTLTPGSWDAVVSLDVIEHIPTDREDDFMQVASNLLVRDTGILVLGTPNSAFDHLASPQSKAGHINNYSAQRLGDLMRKYFHVVQEFGMNDVALHFGHPQARHYLITVGIGPK